MQLLTELTGFLPLPEDDHMFTNGRRKRKGEASSCGVLVERVQLVTVPKQVVIADVCLSVSCPLGLSRAPFGPRAGTMHVCTCKSLYSRHCAGVPVLRRGNGPERPTERAAAAIANANACTCGLASTRLHL